MKGTHSALIKFENSHAFIDGIPDKCDHDTDLIVYTMANGEYLFEIDCRCPTNEATYEYIQNIANKKNTYVNGMTCGCSKCRKPMALNELMGDDYWT